MESYREFILLKISKNQLNEVQADYLMNCLDANGNMMDCLTDLNLKDEYFHFKNQSFRDRQEIDYQKTLLTDKIQNCRQDIATYTTELGTLTPKMTTLLHDSDTLDARYKNYPQNPTYLADREKLLKNIQDIQSQMVPLESKIELLKTELESLEVATTNG